MLHINSDLVYSDSKEHKTLHSNSEKISVLSTKCSAVILINSTDVQLFGHRCCLSDPLKGFTSVMLAHFRWAASSFRLVGYISAHFQVFMQGISIQKDYFAKYENQRFLSRLAEKYRTGTIEDQRKCCNFSKITFMMHAIYRQLNVHCTQLWLAKSRSDLKTAEQSSKYNS